MIFTYKVRNDGELIDGGYTHSIRRFRNKIGTINWKLRGIKVYLRVSGGKEQDVFGKRVSFYNDGWFENKKDLLSALKAFVEK